MSGRHGSSSMATGSKHAFCMKGKASGGGWRWRSMLLAHHRQLHGMHLCLALHCLQLWRAGAHEAGRDRQTDRQEEGHCRRDWRGSPLLLPSIPLPSGVLSCLGDNSVSSAISSFYPSPYLPPTTHSLTSPRPPIPLPIPTPRTPPPLHTLPPPPPHIFPGYPHSLSLSTVALWWCALWWSQPFGTMD